jgi:DNA-binding IclR family transcriptional regulator
VPVSAPEPDDRPLVPAVTRAVAILELLAEESEPLGVSAIARRLGLPKSSVANICGTLVDTGLLRSAGAGFALGQRLAQLGAAYLAGIDQVQLFHEACATLDVARNETVQLAVLGDGLDVIYLARREGVFPVRLASTPGRSLPATCTATGKAMLAELPPAELADRLAGVTELPRLTPKSVGTVDALERQLVEIRRTGRAFDREEVIEGVVCVAAAIPAGGPTAQRMAVSVTLLKPRATRELLAAIGDELTTVTERIALGLGRTLDTDRRAG